MNHMNHRKYSWVRNGLLLPLFICLSGCWVPLYEGILPLSGLFADIKGYASPDLYAPASRFTNPKTGESCGTIILGFPLAKATVLKAAQKAGIKKISSIDYSLKNILGFYVEYCVIVKGK